MSAAWLAHHTLKMSDSDDDGSIGQSSVSDSDSDDSVKSEKTHSTRSSGQIIEGDMSSSNVGRLQR